MFRAPFEVLFLHWSGSSSDEACREVLLDNLFAGHVEAIRIKRAVRLVLHRLEGSTLAVQSLLLLLARIISLLHIADKVVDAANMVLFCFDSEVMRTISAHALQSEIREGKAIVDPDRRSQADCMD